MNAGLPRILTKKNTGLLDIIVFIIKYCLLLDTSELFVASKMELNKNITRNKQVETRCNKGFDLIDFFTEDLFTDTKFFIGGSNENSSQAPSANKTPANKTQANAAAANAAAANAPPAAANAPPANKNSPANSPKNIPQESNKDRQKRIDEEEKLAKEKEIKNSANEEFEKKQQQKNNLEDSAKAEVDAKIEESLTVDTGKTGDESVGSDLLEMIKDVIADGALTVSKKVKGFVMIFVYASVYPAVPFFAVMAAMLALLKYLFYKLRVF